MSVDDETWRKANDAASTISCELDCHACVIVLSDSLMGQYELVTAARYVHVKGEPWNGVIVITDVEKYEDEVP